MSCAAKMKSFIMAKASERKKLLNESLRGFNLMTTLSVISRSCLQIECYKKLGRLKLLGSFSFALSFTESPDNPLELFSLFLACGWKSDCRNQMTRFESVSGTRNSYLMPLTVAVCLSRNEKSFLINKQFVLLFIVWRERFLPFFSGTLMQLIN